MPDFPRLLEKNRSWVQSMISEDPDYFTKLARGQRPPFLFFGCSDSRKCMNSMIGSEPGELFVHRNIANQVPLNDPNVQAVLEFALLNLKVQHVVVAGHTGCGGVGAALAGLEEGAVGAWLTHLRDLAARYRHELELLPTLLDRANRLSEINVVSQLRNVLLSPAYQEARKRGVPPTVHGWMLDLSTGLIREMELPTEEWKQEDLL
ncbi:MAG: carbonic anhydrase [Gemmatimonadota bacterium]|jgi:carbonic anhydrase